MCDLSAAGTAQLLAQFARHFRVPVSWDSSDPAAAEQLLRSFIWLSQAQQQLCYEAAIQYWRRLRADPQALTMGVLYWCALLSAATADYASVAGMQQAWPGPARWRQGRCWVRMLLVSHSQAWHWRVAKKASRREWCCSRWVHPRLRPCRQLNDVWAGASWSSIDVAGRWKPLHYSIKRMYAPFSVQVGGWGGSGCAGGRGGPCAWRGGPHATALRTTEACPCTLQLIEADGDAQMWVINDHPHPMAVHASVSVRPFAAACGHPAARQLRQHANASRAAAGCNSTPHSKAGIVLTDIPVSDVVPAAAAMLMWQAPIDDVLAGAQEQPGQACSRRSCYLAVSASAAAVGGGAGQEQAEAHLLLAAVKQLSLQPPQLLVRDVRRGSSPGAVLVQVTADAAALLVRLDTGGVAGRFDDNSLLMHACQSRALTFHAAGGQPVDVQAFAAQLTVDSVRAQSTWGPGV